jgi:hypothetical protein
MNALASNSSLAGKVAVHFVIDSTGAITNVSDAGSDIADKNVVACVVSTMKTLSFPTPAAGKVDVTYPIVFSPDAPAVAPSSSGLGLSGVGESGGCPCGCDHSAAMADELRHEDRATALAAIDDSLRTIGEREDAGYVTERMVEHRLRLLALGDELGRQGPSRFTPVSRFDPTFGGTTAEGTLVRGELLLHGETTEIVRGAPKRLVTSFVLRLEVENTRDRDVTLRPPSLDAAVGLPVSRWYVAGTDGRAYDGALRAHERRSLYVIGYAAEPVQPRTDVDVTVRFESLELPLTVRARKRWNEST